MRILPVACLPKACCNLYLSLKNLTWCGLSGASLDLPSRQGKFVTNSKNKLVPLIAVNGIGARLMLRIMMV